jgi:hypothetical protein
MEIMKKEKLLGKFISILFDCSGTAMGNLRTFKLFNVALLKLLNFSYFTGKKSTKSDLRGYTLALEPIWVTHARIWHNNFYFIIFFLMGDAGF